KDLKYRFPGRPPLLRNLRFSVERGSMIALLGESGCGKTTTLQILQRFYQPEEGDLLINDTIPWKTISTPTWRSMIGVVPQDITLFHGSLLDNICLDESKQELESAIQFCRTSGFDRYFSQFPQGYATLLGEQGANISGGQRQLVAFARVLFRHPQLLLVDEATAEMDRDTEKWILELLTRLKREMGIIMITHQVRCAKYADHIYIIENGKISTEGPPAELKLGDNLFSRSLEDDTIQNFSFPVEI
ncbi:MAG: ATP-binding cassette domain-containing protein, partial [Calditrichota bacterium]